MWHTGLKNLLTFDEDQQYKAFCETENPSFKKRVKYIVNLKNLKQEELLEKIFNWSKVIYPPPFKMQFCPVERNQRFLCQVCQTPFTMHIQISKCEHIMCYQCLQNHFLKEMDEQEYTCPVCSQIAQKIEFNSQIMREQLETTVMCPFNQPQELTMIFYNQVKITKQNNVENLTDKTFELRKQFNQQKLPFEAVNYRRIEELQKHNGYSDNIMSQMNGVTRKVAFYHYAPVNRKVVVDGCPHQCVYSEILRHQGQCIQTLKQCRYCFAKYPAKIMELHVTNCIQRPVACTICFKEYIRLKDYTGHAVKCLARLDEIIRQQKKFGDYGDQEDIELILKVLHLQNLVNKLTKIVFQMDNMLQNELIEQIDLWNGPKPRTSNKCIWRFTHDFFQKKYLMYTVTESILAVSLLDIAQQYGGLLQTIASSILLLIQVTFFICFIVYAKYFHKFQSFRKSTSKFFVISYFTLIVWFASVFTTIEVLIPGSIDLKSYDSLDYKLRAIQFFEEMIYFSAILGCKTGLGDIVPTNLLSKTAVCIHVLVTTYITLIWFRGLSFIIKIESLYKQTRKQESQQRRVTRALTKEV